MQRKLLNPRGNILMLSLFVLFASALLGVLVSLMMRDFLKYNTEISHYYQANALAKSASELWFMLIGESRAWFDFQGDGAGLIVQNLSCPIAQKQDWKCWLEQHFSLEIKGLKDQISTLLLPGKSLTIPTFYHSINGFRQSWIQVWNGLPSVNNPQLKISLASENWGETKILDSNDAWSLSQGADSTYYIISNLDTEKTQEVIVKSSESSPLFDGTFTMNVQWKYGTKTVSKTYNLNIALPEFLQSDNYLN